MDFIFSLVLPIVIVAVVVIIGLSCVKVVKQSKVGIIMRLGKFRKVADTGVHFLVPFLDQMLHYRFKGEGSRFSSTTSDN